MSAITLNYALYLPEVKEKGWGPKVNLNFSNIDVLLKNLDLGKSVVNHVHAIPAINGLQAALDAKANISHNHAISDVNGLQSLLDGLTARLSRLEASATYTPAPSGQPATTPPPAPSSPGSLSATFASTNIGNAFTFTGSAVTANPASPANVTWNWSFGDGQSRSVTLAGSAYDTAAHTYAAGGTYTVTLTLTSSGYGAFTATQGVTVAVNGTITFDWNCPELVVGNPGARTGTFTPTAVSTSNGASPTLYSWDFGDGQGTTTSSNQAVTHTYPAVAPAASASYNVGLTLSGTGLTTRTVVHAVYVTGSSG